MFRKIEEVQIGGEAPGKAFGGFIYGLDCEMGFNGAPTKVSVNVVSENGRYNISKSDLSTVNPTSIKIGNEINFKRMYLTNYTTSSTADAKLLHLNYVDRTIWFKKIYLGLIHTHGNPLTLKNVKGQSHDRKTFHTQVPIQCFPCSYQDIPKELTNVKIEFRANYGYVHNVDKERGGAVLLGTEEFGKNHCELKQVTYNWNELVHVLKTLGVEILENPDSGEPSITDRGRPENRERFSGALDEVLSQWCDKMGYSWGFDPETEKIYGVDLIDPIETLQNVKNKINNLSASSKIIVTQSEETNSLEGTKIHNHVSSIRRPFHKQQSSTTSFARAIFQNIMISDILAPGYFGGGRTATELIISAVLGKYNAEARKIYNMQLARKKALKLSANLARWSNDAGENLLEPLGITAGYKLTNPEKNAYVNTFIHTPATMQAIQHFQSQYGAGATAFVGTYSKALERRWIDWEKQVADFIGKYYYVEKPAVDFDHCDPGMNMEIHRELTVEPKSDFHTTAEKKKFPFSKLLENHPVTAISPIGSRVLKVKPLNKPPESVAGYQVTEGVSEIIKGATYTILHSYSPLGITPKLDYFKFYKDSGLTQEIKGQSGIPNPGGSPKLVFNVPFDAPAILYYRGEDGSAKPISVTEDKRKQNGFSEIWVHTSKSAYGTAMSQADLLFSDANGKSFLKGLVPQYKELVGYSAAHLLPTLQGIAPAAYNAAIDQLNDGFDPVVWILPSDDFIKSKFSAPSEIEGFTNNEAENIYDTSRKAPPEDSCKDFCDTDLIKEHCRCINPINPIPVRPSFTGKVSPEARYVTFSVNKVPGKIIFPVEKPLVGYHIIKQDLSLIHRAIEYFFGQIKDAGNTMSLSVKTQDITNDLEEQLVNEQDVTEKIDNYSSTDHLPGVAGEGKVRQEGKIIVPNKSWAGGSLQYTAIHPRDYHNSIDHSHEIVDPTEKFTCSLLGLDFSEIEEILKPSKGLVSLSVSYSADGVQTQLAFSNRQLGGNEIALMKEQTFHRLEPLIMLNRFGRTF